MHLSENEMAEIFFPNCFPPIIKYFSEIKHFATSILIVRNVIKLRNIAQKFGERLVVLTTVDGKLDI